MTRERFILCAVAMLASCTATCFAAPEPRAAVATWQFEVRFHDPQRLVVRLPGERKETTFWYVLFEVINDTGRDRQLYPSIRLVTDTLHVVEAGAGIHPVVYDMIAGRHRGEFPFFAPPTKISGLLLQGKQNARASAAVFRDFDTKASGFTIYTSGFAGDMERIVNPAFDSSVKESESNMRFFTLRRTLAITYDLPGDPGSRGQAKPIRRTRAWVMR